MTLAARLKPCGPVTDAAAAARLKALLGPVAEAEGWAPVLEAAWPALAPVVAASSYLSGLARRDPAGLGRLLSGEPGPGLEAIIAETQGVGSAGDAAAAAPRLRRLKASLHLLTALADLGGVWDLDQVTSALTRFADAALQAGVAVLAAQEEAAGRLRRAGDQAHGPDARLVLHRHGQVRRL